MPNDRTSPLKRCAIYTRKSTNHLLERDVNSLTTQREICSAYVTSQQYRGWIELPHGYDDGGHSGSRLERPALSNLMRDIEAGSVDTVVIYKIDRLTRSLLDFVRLIEIFDRRGVALVSVSQAFDTSDSMGRMILNVLLTFSQFERELIAERVRDSIRTRSSISWLRCLRHLPCCLASSALHRVRPDMPLTCSLSADILQSSRLHRF